MMRLTYRLFRELSFDVYRRKKNMTNENTVSVVLDVDERRRFRQALGRFATGVTIITTVTPDGKYIGMTANSFNSVSLDPPMVLWSIARNASNYSHFSKCQYFAVHILSGEQKNLSEQFSQKVEDRFSGVDINVGQGGLPLIKDVSAIFQCKMSYQYEGGDHVILVGEVLEFDQYECEPLIFHSGQYAKLHKDKNPN